MWISYQLQLPHGWTSLGIEMNTIAVVLLIPTLLVIVPRHGMLGAAWKWVLLIAGYLVFGEQIMHRRDLRLEIWTSYLKDVGAPLGAALSAAYLSSFIPPTNSGRVELIPMLAATLVVSLGGSAVVAPKSRRIGMRLIVRARPAISKTSYAHYPPSVAAEKTGMRSVAGTIRPARLPNSKETAA